MPQITPRDAVTRAMAAMEIADSCSHPEIRSSFTSLAENWLETAAEAANPASRGAELASDEADTPSY